MTMSTLNPHDLAARQQADASISLIDVRTPIEYREMHVPFAKNVPLGTLDPATFDRGQTHYVICRSGGRGQKACDQLSAAGLNVVNIEGGTLAWEQAGLPVTRGAKAMSLERQVRIAAGSLVVIGVVLGFLVHPGLFGISAFVGSGLVFAGITDFCGMGLHIARMPWNRVRDSATCAMR